AMKLPRVARGIISADIDRDGDLDVLLTINNGVPVLLRNDAAPSSPPNNALRLTLVGTKSNRSAIGATVEAQLQTPGQTLKEVVRGMVKSGSSYLSQSELPLTLGLGQQTEVTDLIIHWPSGKQTQLHNVGANQALTIDEDRGIIQKQPLSH
ncbi:MAG: CRTAC1 family protein, partial [Cytophagaceae bacterium]